MRTITLIKVALFLILAAIVAMGVAYGLALIRETRAPESDPPEGGRFVETAEGPVHVLEWGDPDDRTLLLLHGTGAWAGLWAPTGEALAAEGFHVVAMDLPPFGFTPRRPGADYARPAQAARVLALAEVLEGPVLVAHSVGAGPGAAALLREPEAFDGAVLVAGAIGLGASAPPPLPRMLRRGLSALLVTNPAFTERWLRLFVHRDEVVTEEMVEMLQEPLRGIGLTDAVAEWLPTLLGAGPGEVSRREETWEGHEGPVALIWGEEDGVTPPEDAERLDGLLRDSRLAVLPGVGHIPQIEDPEAFRAALLEALEWLER